MVEIEMLLRIEGVRIQQRGPLALHVEDAAGIALALSVDKGPGPDENLHIGARHAEAEPQSMRSTCKQKSVKLQNVQRFTAFAKVSNSVLALSTIWTAQTVDGNSRGTVCTSGALLQP